jgi:hypothetical protein
MDPVADGTNALLTLNSVGFAQGGSYSIVVTSAYGSATNGPVNLTVVDTVPPLITACAPNTTISADLSCSAIMPDLTGQVVASDPSGSVTVTQNPLPGATLPVGPRSVTFSASDSSANTAYCSCTVTVSSTTIPQIVFSVPEVSLDPTNCQYLPDLTSTNYIVAVDNCASITVTQMPPAGFLLPPGTNAVVLTVFDNYNNTNSATVSVIVPGTPNINVQPTNVSAIVTSNASFSVGVCGPDLAYQWQWQLAGIDLAAGTNAVLTLSNVSTNDAGDYQVVITNSYGSITSVVATLTVLQPPVITSQPQSLVAVPGNQAAFSVAVTGLAPFAYQWRTNGGAIVDQTNATLTLASVQLSDFGYYTVLVTNLDGWVLSDTASLTLATAPVIATPSRGPGGLTFSFPTQVGPNYTVEYTLSLSPPSWQLLTNCAGTGSPITLTDPFSTNRAVYYRIHLQ